MNGMNGALCSVCKPELYREVFSIYREAFSSIGWHFRVYGGIFEYREAISSCIGVIESLLYRSVVRKLIPLDLATAPNVSNRRSPPPGYCLCRKTAAYYNSTGSENVPV